MLHKVDLEDNQVVGFRWEGKFDEKGAKQSILQFMQELQMRPKFSVYMEIGSLTEVEAKGIWEELKFEAKNYKDLINKIEKVALVTDMDWMRTIADSSSFMLPNIRLKSFKMQEAEAAKTWIKS